MQEQSRYAIGIDVGTTKVRCVVGHIDPSNGVPTIVGVGEASSSGMRKGVVSTISGPATAIDAALGEAERMSGHEVDSASISINGAHIGSMRVEGMIAVSNGHEITAEDIMRVEDVATVGKLPANREILDVIPHTFRLDGQDNIQDPIGMTGNRLEVDAHVVAGLAPHVENMRKVSAKAGVEPQEMVVSVVAAARSVLTEKQRESGVAVVDLGGATTGVAVYEEGDLQHLGVIPIGGMNITNDLAIGLKTDPEIAEAVKLKHGMATIREESETVSVKHDRELMTFETKDIDEIIDARLEEIFEHVQEELSKAGRAGKLPSGIVLTGDGAHMRHISQYAKEALGLAVKLGKPTGFGGVAEGLAKPESAAVVGLMLLSTEYQGPREHTNQESASKKKQKLGGKKLFSKVFNLYK